MTLSVIGMSNFKRPPQSSDEERDMVQEIVEEVVETFLGGG